MTRAQIKKKAAANSAASASSAPSASRSAPLTEKEKHKAEQALVKQNIEKSIQALAKEAIHVSATPTRIEDSEKFFKGVLAAAKQMQAVHKLEQAQIAAAQAAADALEENLFVLKTSWGSRNMYCFFGQSLNRFLDVFLYKGLLRFVLFLLSERSTARSAWS